MCRNPYLLLAMFLVFAACTPRVKENTASPVRLRTIQPTAVSTQPHPEKIPLTDTSVTLFGKKAYQVNLRIFRPGAAEDCRPNAVLTYTDHDKILLRDSLHCGRARLTLEDYNHDKVKDLLVYYAAEGKWHAIPTYYLYVLNKKKHRIIRVPGFENIPSPAYDPVTNIISGAFPRGDQEMCTFYRVSKKGKLANLGHSFTGKAVEDSVQWNYAIGQIIERWKVAKGE